MKQTPYGNLKRTFGLIFCVVFLFFSAACSTSKKVPAIKINEVLDQVSYALKRAYDLNGDKGPKVTSVQIEMQVLTVIDTKASLPTVSIVPDLESTNKTTHFVSLTFAPQFDKLTVPQGVAATGQKETALTLAMRSVFESLNESNANFSFQKGSVQLQCAIEEEVTSSLKIPLIVPIQIGSDNSNQVVHTITLNFEPKTNVAAAGTSAATSISADAPSGSSDDKSEASGGPAQANPGSPNPGSPNPGSAKHK